MAKHTGSWSHTSPGIKVSWSVTDKGAVTLKVEASGWSSSSYYGYDFTAYAIATKGSNTKKILISIPAGKMNASKKVSKSGTISSTYGDTIEIHATCSDSTCGSGAHPDKILKTIKLTRPSGGTSSTTTYTGPVFSGSVYRTHCNGFQVSRTVTANPYYTTTTTTTNSDGTTTTTTTTTPITNYDMWFAIYATETDYNNEDALYVGSFDTSDADYNAANGILNAISNEMAANTGYKLVFYLDTDEKSHTYSFWYPTNSMPTVSMDAIYTAAATISADPNLAAFNAHGTQYSNCGSVYVKSWIERLDGSNNVVMGNTVSVNIGTLSNNPIARNRATVDLYNGYWYRACACKTYDVAGNDVVSGSYVSTGYDYFTPAYTPSAVQTEAHNHSVKVNLSCNYSMVNGHKCYYYAYVYPTDADRTNGTNCLAETGIWIRSTELGTAYINGFNIETLANGTLQSDTTYYCKFLFSENNYDDNTTLGSCSFNLNIATAPSVVWIFTNGQWRRAKPYVYKNGKWNPTRPETLSNQSWHEGNYD